jgi:hypothetical protein
VWSQLGSAGVPNATRSSACRDEQVGLAEKDCRDTWHDADGKFYRIAAKLKVRVGVFDKRRRFDHAGPVDAVACMQIVRAIQSIHKDVSHREAQKAMGFIEHTFLLIREQREVRRPVLIGAVSALHTPSNQRCRFFALCRP